MADGWKRSPVSRRLLAPHQADARVLREEQARIREQARAAAKARPMTEEEIAALVRAFPEDAVKRCPPAEAPEERLRWPSPPRRFGK